MEIPLEIVIFAILVDLIVGDPRGVFHPVQAIGFLITRAEPFFRAKMASHEKWAGAVFAITIISFCTLFAFGVAWLAYLIHPFVGLLVEVGGIASALAINALAREGWDVLRLLVRGDDDQARARVSLIVSRDLSHATRHDIIRALLETMTENLSDGVIAPLCFAVLGGLPGVWFYKSVNTLDSMVGYKNEKYLNFGWFSARLDDVVNYIPARITGGLMVLTSVLLGRRPWRAVCVWRVDAQKGPSPNGGIPIVVFAGAQDIALGGPCVDKEGKVIEIPFVGGSRKALGLQDIRWVLAFHYSTVFLFVGILILLFSMSDRCVMICL